MREAGENGKRTLSVDVADGGESETIIGRRTGRLILPFESYPIPDTTQIAHHVEKDLNAGFELAVVDSNGVGSGTTSTLRHDGYPVFAYKGSLGTTETDSSGELHFANTRSAAYWSVREVFDPRNPNAIGLSEDHPLLKEDLVGLKYHEVTGGRIAVEEKDKVVRRLGRSPDRGDTLAMLIYGSGRHGVMVTLGRPGGNGNGRTHLRKRGALEGIFS